MLAVRRSRTLLPALGAVVAIIASGGGVAGAAGTSPRSTASPGSSPSGAVAWGENSAGELGTGNATRSTVPVPVAGVSGIGKLVTGNRFSLAVLAAGGAVAWGNNTTGQLGDGNTTSTGVAVPVHGLSAVTTVAAGGSHGVALLTGGTLMTWGDNSHGQLGIGSRLSTTVPVAVPGLSGVKAIAAGEQHTLAVLGNGTVMAWGSNADGQLGNGTLADSSTPVAVKGLTGVTAVAAGGRFSLALLANGKVMAWGQGDGGQLGNGNTVFSDIPVAVINLTGVTAISAGEAHAVALLGDGTARAWGENSFGQLGHPQCSICPQMSDVPVPVDNVTGATAVAAGGMFSLSLLGNGTVMSWGDNALGQLGNGGPPTFSVTPAAVPGLSGASAIAAGANHALVRVPTSGAPVPRTPLSIFHTVVTPNPGGASSLVDDSFSAVSAASPADAMAVGTNQVGITAKPMTARWDGHAWKTETVPQPAGRQATLSGVVDLAPGNAWAVGRSVGASPNNQDRTLIEHWNGTAWSIVPSPNPLGGVAGNDELSVVGGVKANDLWAVGDDFNNVQGGSIVLLFEHFDGTKWSAVPFSSQGGFQFALGIAAIAANDVWVVGTNAFQTTLAAHWNGTAWSIVPTPSLQDGIAPGNALTGVTAVSTNNVFASGFEDNVNQQNFRKPYVEHWDGTAWSLVTLPNTGSEGSKLSGAVALSASDVWAVGQTQENDGSILTLAERFDGSNWAIVPTPDPGSLGPIVDSSLDATASPGGGVVWALGAQETLDRCCVQTLGMQTTSG